MSVGSLKVKIFDASGTQLVAVPKSTLTVGSANHCDIVLNHPSVLPEHVRGWLDGGRIWVQDLGAQSGTFLNGIRLPSLKPMLVRDLDVLKVGECVSTLGLEANLVRAPVVKPRPVVEEQTMTDIRPLVTKDPEVEKRREEALKLSRELAELKLQLQMGRLEKSAEDELHRQTAKVRDELRKLSLERDALSEVLERLEQEEKAKRSSLEKELQQLRSDSEKELARQKAQAEKQIADMKAAATREVEAAKEAKEATFTKTARLNLDEDWKRTTVHQLNEQVKELGEVKAKAWVTRPMSKDMIFELQSDLRAIFRRTLLNEEITAVDVPQAPEVPEVKPPSTQTKSRPILRAVPDLPKLPEDESGYEATIIAPKAPVETPSGVTGIAYLTKNPSKTSMVPASEITRSQIRSQTRSSPMINLNSMFARGAYGLMAGCALGFVIYYGQIHLLNSKPESEVAQQPAKPAVQQRGLAAVPAPPAPTRFEPKQTKGFKKSYTDNALYTSLYIEAELNSEFRSLWLAEVEKAARTDWKVDERTLSLVSEKEFGMIQDLRRLRETIQPQKEAEGIQRMRDREMQFMTDLQGLLKKNNAEKYLKLKRNFFNRNQAYLIRR